MPELFSKIDVCEHMKWTIQEYASQPPYFLQALKAKMNIDNTARKNNGS